ENKNQMNISIRSKLLIMNGVDLFNVLDIRKKMRKLEFYKNSAYGIYSLSAGGCPASSFICTAGSHLVFFLLQESRIFHSLRFKLSSFSTRKSEYPIFF